MIVSYVELTVFLLLPVSALNTIVHNQVPKPVVEKFSFSELKIKKVTFFTHQNFCIGVFNVGGCLASCLTFRLFLTLGNLVAYHKNVYGVVSLRIIQGCTLKRYLG